MKRTISDSVLQHLDVVRSHMLSPNAPNRGVLESYFRDTISRRFPASVLSSAPRLLESLFELEWIREEDGLLRNNRWVSKVIVPGENDIWIVRDMPSAVGIRRGRNYEWSDEASDLIETIDIERIRRLRPGSRVLDLCTGSGALAVATSILNREVTVTGVDISDSSMFDVEANFHLNRLPIDRLELVKGDLWTPIQDQSFDIVLCNPPVSLRPPGWNVSEKFDGGEHGDGVSARVLGDALCHLQDKNSRLYMLAYSLGGVELDKLRLHTLVQENVGLKVHYTRLQKKVWRFQHRKAFSNPMPIEYMSSRFGDPFKEGSLHSRSVSEIDQEIARMEAFEKWVERLKFDEWSHLWYILVEARKN